jgi:hypothetical protein
LTAQKGKPAKPPNDLLVPSVVFMLVRKPRIVIAYAMSGNCAAQGAQLRRVLDGFPHHPIDCRLQRGEGGGMLNGSGVH